MSAGGGGEWSCDKPKDARVGATRFAKTARGDRTSRTWHLDPHAWKDWKALVRPNKRLTDMQRARSLRTSTLLASITLANAHIAHLPTTTRAPAVARAFSTGERSAIKRNRWRR